MRILTGFASLAAIVLTMDAPTYADDCVNTAKNNPAFSSDYVASAKPCPPPVAPARKPAQPDKTTQGNADMPSRTKTASTKSADPNHPTITTTPNGHTLLKTGDTTICMSGSVSATMVTGGGRLRGTPLREHDSSEPACD